MTIDNKEIEFEVIIITVNSKGEEVILDLRTTKPQIEESSEQRLARAIEPLPKSDMERMGREVAKGYMDVVQKQMQESTQVFQTFLPSTSPPNTIRLILSKGEYEQLGKPTVFDKLTLKLGKSSRQL